jgi:NADH-quinone oxidoreductase subunit L
VGDFGFGLGVLLIYLTFNSLSYDTVFEMVRQGVMPGGEPIPDGRIAIIALLLFCGAVGKSAQLPLHVWLPDAMEGPTPVSALIHAATMVTAGVYMVARCGVIFTACEGVMNLIAIIGGLTALFAATIALTQHDMKRILAYSTISQLGFMFLGLGVFAAGAAIFHLFTHAFFKALLFLGAGSVMHAMGGIIDLRQFGGLKKVLPWTYRTFLIGGLALAGFPLLSGFFSKDEIIHAAIARQPVLGIMAMATAVLTAFYTFRMFYRAFHGPTRVPPGVHPHESGAWMLVPLFVLAMGAAGAGFLNVQFARGGFLGFVVPHGWLGRFLEPALEGFGAHATASEAPAPGGHFSQYGLLYMAALSAIAGIAAARYVYVRRPVLAERAAAAAPRVYRVLFNKYYVDELYDRAIVQPLWRLGRACFSMDNYFIDGLLWLITAIPRGLAFVLRTVQAGALQGYGLAMLAGFIILLILALR